jgi:hypothetical protein
MGFDPVVQQKPRKGSRHGDMPAETAECKHPRMITGMETYLRRSRRRAGRSDDGTADAKTAMLRGSVDGAPSERKRGGAYVGLARSKP